MKGKCKCFIQKLWKAVLSFPDQNRDPRYMPLPEEPWDEKVTVKSQVWKR